MSINFADLNAAYETAKFGEEPPTLAYMSYKTSLYLHWYFGDDFKIPRKLKKWAIGTRSSRRRIDARWKKLMAQWKRNPLHVDITFERSDLVVSSSDPDVAETPDQPRSLQQPQDDKEDRHDHDDPLDRDVHRDEVDQIQHHAHNDEHDE